MEHPIPSGYSPLTSILLPPLPPLPPALFSLQNLLTPYSPDPSPIILRQHQLWKLSVRPSPEPNSPDIYAEILGWQEDISIINVRLWKVAFLNRLILHPLHPTDTTTSLPLSKVSQCTPSGRYDYPPTPCLPYRSSTFNHICTHMVIISSTS